MGQPETAAGIHEEEQAHMRGTGQKRAGSEPSRKENRTNWSRPWAGGLVYSEGADAIGCCSCSNISSASDRGAGAENAGEHEPSFSDKVEHDLHKAHFVLIRWLFLGCKMLTRRREQRQTNPTPLYFLHNT